MRVQIVLSELSRYPERQAAQVELDLQERQLLIEQVEGTHDRPSKLGFNPVLQLKQVVESRQAVHL
jgi:hypothetical protein